MTLNVKAKPGARQDAVFGVRGGELLVAVRAVAEKGRANTEITCRKSYPWGLAGREAFGRTPLWIGARREVWDGRERPVNRRRREDRPQPAEILFCDAPLPAFWTWSSTEIRPEQGKGEGLVNSAQKPPDREGQRRS